MKNGRIFDITRPLAPGCIVYPGDIVPGFAREDHGNYRITDIQISSHSGTHIDAPSHYLDEGASVDEIPLSHLMGWCRVADLTRVKGEISPRDLEGKTGGAKKILLKTSFSGQDDFVEDYPSIGEEAAAFLAAQRMHCIGTDAPSIEEFNSAGPFTDDSFQPELPLSRCSTSRGVPEGQVLDDCPAPPADRA